MTQHTYDRILAGTITAILVALLLIWLFIAGVRIDREALAEASVPELTEPEEEYFIEPEPLIQEEKGEEDAPEIKNQQEAPTEQGEPEKVEKPEQESEKTIVPGPNPKPAPQREQPVTQKQPSPVQTTPPPKTDKQESKVKSTMANQFSGKNGKPDGKTGGFGTGGTGSASVAGKSKGRKMESCPHPSVALKTKVIITVNVQIAENGTVVSAKGSGSAEKYLITACENAAMKSRWTAKPGAGTVAGTITFTITPKL